MDNKRKKQLMRRGRKKNIMDKIIGGCTLSSAFRAALTAKPCKKPILKSTCFNLIPGEPGYEYVPGLFHKPDSEIADQLAALRIREERLSRNRQKQAKFQECKRLRIRLMEKGRRKVQSENDKLKKATIESHVTSISCITVKADTSNINGQNGQVIPSAFKAMTKVVFRITKKQTLAKRNSCRTSNMLREAANGAGLKAYNQAKCEQTAGGRRPKPVQNDSFQKKMEECCTSELKNDGFAGGVHNVPTLMTNYTATIEPAEAMTILNNVTEVHKSRVTCVAPFRPRGGEVYLFSATGKLEQADDYKADGYRWKTGGGGVLLPVSSPTVKRFYSRLVTSAEKDGDSGFTRTWYRLVQKSGRKRSNGKDEMEELIEWTLVHYLGDETLYQKMAHGNSNPQSTAEFIRSAPSLLAELKQSCPTGPQLVYKTELAKKGVPITKKARNKKQVKNHQHLQRDHLRLTQDGITNIIEFGLQVKDFVHSVNFDVANENVLVFLISKDLCRRLSQVLYLPRICDRPVQLQYDTTFRVGDHYYVSTLSFRHPSFQSYPPIPFAFLISMRKFAKDHLRLFEFVKDACPALTRKPSVIVTDREFRNLETIFPQSEHLYCWKHVGSDIENWVRQHKSQDTREPMWYASEIRALMHCDDPTSFESVLAAKKQKWSKAFMEYFDAHVKQDLLAHTNRWKLEKLGLYDGASEAITTNAAEGVNTMLKSINNFAPMLMDTCVMSLHFLCKSLAVDEELSRAGRGSWGDKLCKEHQRYALDIAQVADDEDFRTPDEIVKFMKSRAEEALKGEPDKAAYEQLENSSKEVEADRENFGYDDFENSSFHDDENVPSKNITTSPKQISPLKTNYPKHDTQRTMAVNLVAQQRIYRVPNPHCDGKELFMAEGANGKYHAVCLQLRDKKWKESCGCVAQNTCYHILGARLMLGIPLVERTGRPLNLTGLLQKSRPPKDRCRGSKVPRQNDFLNVNAAPDSLLATSASSASSFPHLSSTPIKRKAQSHHSVNQKRPSIIPEHVEPSDASLLNNIGLEDDIEAKPESSHIADKNEEHVDTSNALHGSTAPVEQAKTHAQTCVSPSTDKPINPGVPSENRKKQDKYCFCKEVKESAYIQCSRCQKEWYHASCVKAPLSAVENLNEDWHCPMCSLPTLFRWGGTVDGFRLLNSCPIDNALSLFAVQCLKNPKTQALIGSKQAEVALKGCITEFMQGQLSKAKCEWVKFLLTKGKVKKDPKTREIDLYGGELDLCFGFFNHVYKMTGTSTCSSVTCQERVLTHFYPLPIINEEDTVESVFQMRLAECSRITGTLDLTDCNRICSPICMGTRSFTSRTFVSPRPWFIVVDCSNCSITKALSLPNMIMIDGQQFSLGGVTVHSACENHFTAVISWCGQKFHYNGSRRNIIIQAEKAQLKTCTPNMAVYFLEH